VTFIVLADDCRVALARMSDNSVDSVVTDPPYEYGFMGKAWDSTGIAFNVGMWREVFRVLKPGGYLLSFGATRTVHRIACAIEDAGFEIRDQLAWMFGSGFPKSLNVGGGWGTALKPAMEPVIVARKPLIGTVVANVLEWGTGAINIDGCRIGDEVITAHGGGVEGGRTYGGGKGLPAIEAGANPHVGRWPSHIILDEEAGAMLDAQTGTLTSGLMKAGTQRDGIGYMGGLGTEVRNDTHGDSGGASRFFYCPKADGAQRDAGLEDLPVAPRAELVDREADSAGIDNPRAGAGRTSEGRRNIHPTVKPIDLMRYLCTLVTPVGGTVLDPFCGSGSTLVGGILGGFNVIGIDMETPHALIALKRCEHWSAMTLKPDTTARAVAEKPSAGPTTIDMFAKETR
jgi:DNA modification methylase